MTSFNRIYRPIRQELKGVESLLSGSLQKTADPSILEVNRYLLETPGKRLRPALVMLSAYASVADKGVKIDKGQLSAIGAAVELIHMASLIHDDIIDHAPTRHNKPSINAKWGNEVSIALGDYLYSKAFELIASCKNTEVLTCLSKAMAAMCEGELTQVKERDNLRLKKRQYFVIIKQKTASLMASCCRAGAASVNGKFIYKQALENYGLNFGIAFQIRDDYLDLTANPKELGKPTGLDLKMGELTLPFLILSKEKQRKILKAQDSVLIKGALEKSGVLSETRSYIENYAAKAKLSLNACSSSEYKDSLLQLADIISKN